MIIYKGKYIWNKQKRTNEIWQVKHMQSRLVSFYGISEILILSQTEDNFHLMTSSALLGCTRTNTTCYDLSEPLASLAGMHFVQLKQIQD